MHIYCVWYKVWYTVCGCMIQLMCSTNIHNYETYIHYSCFLGTAVPSPALLAVHCPLRLLLLE
jgi:hypothetical protein